jgi:hypothetical protein
MAESVSMIFTLIEYLTLLLKTEKYLSEFDSQ